jgi:hypothetical protein
LIGSKIAFKEASATTHANRNRIHMVTAGDGRSGAERLAKPIPEIVITPKFKLDGAGRFFAIGSCFARNIEIALSRSGVDCITTRALVPGDLYEISGLGARNGMLNAYTPHSMCDMVHLPMRADALEAGMLQVGEDEWIDMLVSGIKPLPRAELTDVRAKVIDLYRDMALADVVVVTLGYTESWYDNQDQIFVNRSPSGSTRTIRRGERYSFQNISASQAAEALAGIAGRVRTVTEGRAKLILTTSPVPLHATFTNRDVICANQYSKSTLLSAAVELASRYDWIDYYPSYEMVMGSDRDLAWTEDGVHVKATLVDQVISRFTQAYLA